MTGPEFWLSWLAVECHSSSGGGCKVDVQACVLITRPPGHDRHHPSSYPAFSIVYAPEAHIMFPLHF